MSCQVIRNVDTNEIEKVLAPNGKESILYKDINEYVASKEEALLAYAQIYTPSFKEWFGDWEGGKKPVAETKSGVEELFDSNPELANAVYEALGYSEKVDYKKESTNIKYKDITTKYNFENIETSLNSVLKNTKNPNFRRLATTFLNIEELKDVDIKVDNTIPSNGSYSFMQDSIKINLNRIIERSEIKGYDTEFMIEEVILHEIVHALTKKETIKLSDQNEFIKKIKDLWYRVISSETDDSESDFNKYIDIYRELKKDRDSVSKEDYEFVMDRQFKYYGLTSIDEFLTMSMTNPVFRNKLKSTNLWEIFIDYVSNLLKIKKTDLDYLEDNFDKFLKSTYNVNLDSIISPQQQQEAQKKYSAYLNNIFPNSKTKDILYHDSNVDLKTTTYDKDKIGQNDGTVSGNGISFYSKEDKWLGGYYDRTRLYNNPSMINLSNPIIKKDFIAKYNAKTLEDAVKKATNQSLKNISKHNKVVIDIATPLQKVLNVDGVINKFQEGFKYLVFEPEQIHPLGSKKDIEGFKKFVEGKQTKETSAVSQVVDANGEPKLVFHWSPVHGIRRFNLAGIGSHFGTLQAADEINEAKTKTILTLVDKEMGTEEERETEGEPGAFYPAFLNLRNMAKIIDKGQHTEEKDGAEAKDLLDKGHDGFEYINQFEDIGSTSYVATQESQIKSLYNKGTFSKKSGDIYANLKGEGEINEPVTAGAIKQLEDEGMITKAGTALNNFTINEYTAENVNKVQDLLESKSIEYKRTGDNIQIYGPPLYKYSYEFAQLDTEDDEINSMQDLKKELGITSKPLSYAQFNDIARSLKAYNDKNETHYLVVADQQQDGSITVKTIVEDKTRNRSTLDVTQELMDRMQALFPEIKVQYINQNELSKFSDGRFSNADLSVNTFVKDGIVFLVKDRFTGDMVIEEFLHPFVSAIMFDNPILADSLYVEMLERYPDIANMVEKVYTDAKGWTEEDRKNEIITKGLQRAFSEKLQDSFKAKDKVIKGLMERVLDWVKNLIRKITGRKKLYTKDLSTTMSADEIINMLDSNIQVKLGFINPNSLANLSQEKIDILNYILKNATAEQKEVVETLFDNGIVHNEIDHTYEKVIFDKNGEVEDIINYTSMTTAIKGEFTDTAYALNRDIGTEFDFIMNSVVMGEDFDSIKLQLNVVSEKAAGDFYNMIMNVLVGIKSSGAIIVPQVVLGADADGIAGKLDLLIVDPSGKMRIIDLKTSATNDVTNDPKKYNKKYEITNEDSMLNGEKLSNRDLHALQQHGYKRMIELDGRLTEYEVESVKTLHYRFKIEDGMATEVMNDMMVDHTDAHVDKLLDKIIESQPLERTSGLSTSLSAEQAKPENQETVDDIRDLVKDAVNMLQKRKEFYEKINETSKGKFIVTKEYLSALDDIIVSLNEGILVGKPASAYYQLVKYINQDVKDKARLLGKMTDRSENLQFMLETEKDLLTYQQLLLPPKLYLNNKTIDKLAKESLNTIDQTLYLINNEIHGYTVDFIANNTSRDLTREEIEGIIKEAEDISMHEYRFGDLSTSSDLMLSVMDKVYKRKRQEIIDFVQKLELEIKTAGNKLAAVSPDKSKMYDFMIGTDDKGNLTGYTIDKIGKQYWSMKRELREKLTDPETGLRYKYRDIRNPKDASSEDIKFNMELKKLKEEEAEFTKKEYLNDKGVLVDGPYHKYTEDFKDARSKVMRLKLRRNADGDVTGFDWIAKNADSKEYKAFEKKYYGGEVIYLGSEKDYDKSSKTYIFKGRTEEKSGRFVKSEYVEIREIAEGGKDMRDEKYVKIMTDNTELGLAQKEYYETWKRLYAELLEKLPNGVKMRTKLPVITSGMIAQAKKMGGGANYYKSILKGVGNAINPFSKSTFHHSVMLDENGNVVSNIPVFFVSDLKSEYVVEKTREKITELNQRWAKKTPDADGNILSYDEYRKQLDKLTKSLKIEQNKTSANELSTEMTNNLVQFAEMAENFQVMSEFESTVVSVLRTLKNRKVTKRDADGNFITNSVDKTIARFKGDADDSLTERRLRKWMDMVLYNSKNPYRSRMGTLVKKVKLLMSVKGVGLNPFGQLNNLKMGNINNMVEAGAGTVFNKKDYKKAIKGYTAEYLPAFLSAKKDYVLSLGKDKNGDYYSLPKSLTKYDALVNKYRMMRAMQSKDGIEGYEGKTMDLLFMMQHGAEFSIQSKSGIAVLNNRTFTNKVTGQQVSIYDAHSFDQKTGELILDSSLYEETDQERYDMTNLIYETNKRLHGNYAWEDRMVIQQKLIGEMLAQFHKWVYPYVRRFWGKTYHDENLGESEGIFRSFAKLNKAIYDMTKLEGSFWKGILKKQTFTEAWATMSDYQKANITRLLGYLGFYLLSMIMKWIWSAIADELGDDEDTSPTTMKLVNFMAYLDDRTMGEISVAIDPTQVGQFIKNPVAIVGFITDAWDAISETANFIAPWTSTEDVTFQRGVNKGEYKWQKEWGDILPFFSAINKWDSFEELKSFYIK